MREELGLSQSIISFENFGELLEELDQYIEINAKLTKRYEDRLGYLLRLAKDSNDPRLQNVSRDFAGLADPESENSGKKKKDDKKRSSDEKGWITLEDGEQVLRIASGSDALVISNEISILFKVIETLKSRVEALNSARRLFTSLPSRGLDSNRSLRVVFKDGVPRYVIPAGETSIQRNKFKYSESFTLTVLK